MSRGIVGLFETRGPGIDYPYLTGLIETVPLFAVDEGHLGCSQRLVDERQNRAKLKSKCFLAQLSQGALASPKALSTPVYQGSAESDEEVRPGQWFRMRVAGKFSGVAFGLVPFLTDDGCLDRVTSEPEMVVTNRPSSKDALSFRQCLAPLIWVIRQNR
jgi:hypothetical protein